jgi:hypothetical protein
VLEEAEAGQTISEERLALLTDSAFDLLRRAAREIPDIELFLKQFSGK